MNPAGAVDGLEATHQYREDCGGKPDRQISAGIAVGVFQLNGLKERSRRVLASSGWHAILGILDDQLHARVPRPFWTTFMKLKSEYEKRFAEA